MAEGTYFLCACTSTLCAFLLVRQYLRSRLQLLLWSSLCFLGLALNSALLFIDLVIVPNVDLSLPRTLVALAGLSFMVFGLVWERA